MQFWLKWKNAPITNLLKLLLLFVATTAIFWLAGRVAGLLIPFVLALLCSLAMEPLIRVLCRIRLGSRQFPRSAAAVIAMLVMGVVVGGALVVLVNVTISQFNALMRALPGWIDQFSDTFARVMEWAEGKLDLLPEATVENIVAQVQSALGSVGSQLSGLVSPVAKGVWSTALSVPYLVLVTVMWLVGTFYICVTRPRIVAYMKRELPPKWLANFASVRERLLRTLVKYIRAQLILSSVVFLITLAGLLILQVPYMFVLALLVGVVDLLPGVGSGFVLNPWAVYCALTGDYKMAIGLPLIYVAALIGRNLLEPRLVGAQIGLHPLLTMMSMYVGMRIVGVAGIIVGPLLVITLRIAYDYYARGRTLKEVLLGTPAKEKEPPAEEKEIGPDGG